MILPERISAYLERAFRGTAIEIARLLEIPKSRAEASLLSMVDQGCLRREGETFVFIRRYRRMRRRILR